MLMQIEHIKCLLVDAMVKKITWSDEASVKLNANVNRDHCVHSSLGNPKSAWEQQLNRAGVTVWGASSAEGLIGPYFP